MAHPTTLAMAELKRVLASANKTDSMRKLGSAPTIPATVTTAAAFGADVDAGPAWVALGNGKHVDGILFRRVKREVMDRVSGLPAGRLLSMKKICSPEFWASLDNADKQQAGRCLMHLVSKKQVNLSLVSLHGASPQLYCKKP
jgi:hypothetical protein